MLRQKRNNFLIILRPIEIIISFLLKLHHRNPKIFNSNVSVSCVEEWFVEEKVVLLVRCICKRDGEKRTPNNPSGKSVLSEYKIDISKKLERC